MAGRYTKALARVAGAALLLVTAIVAEAQEAGARYTAQQRPRVAVMEFEDTNTEARKEGYASSVEAMLSTFLQSKSQLVVVERQELDGLYEEKRRIQQGLVDPEGDDASELLKKTDAIIIGTVALLDGTRIEINAKLLAGFDGEIFATARRSGPKTCLSAIVERLGAALEQDFLRRYRGNGSLEIRLTTPENVRIFLTPIPLDTAEAPAERSSSVKIGGDYDVVEPWITAPTSYTIRNLLPGWYTLRLSRPGYEDLKTDTRRFEVRLRSGQAEVYDRKTGLPLSEMDPELRRFVVHVDPQAPAVVDGDALGFSFRKKGGSLAFRVKRQYLDTDFSRVPQRVMLMGGRGLDLNHSEEPREPDAEPQCNLLRERPAPLPGYTLTRVAFGQAFDFAAFQGGELIIEDYRGETVPAGTYQWVPWDAHYRVEKPEVTVRDGDNGKVVERELDRATLPLTLKMTGAPPPGYHVILEGRETKYHRKVPLDFFDTKERGLPADTYKVSTNIPGLERWKQIFDHFPGNPIPPLYHKGSAYKPEVTDTYEKKPERPSSLIVKTRFVLAGRTDVLSRRPSSSAADLFIDEEVGEILDLLLQTSARQPGSSNEIRQRAEKRLELTDLLILNSQDMDKLRQSPELAKLVQDYVGKGGALFAFVYEPGDYGAVTGAPLVIEAQGKVITKRLSSKLSSDSWRVSAFTEERKAPRVLERGEKGSGGYVAVWLDNPVSFRDRPRRAASRLEKARGAVEECVLKWGRYLMYRRYDKSGKLSRQAAEALGF